MELGRTSRLLQSRLLGRMVESLSSAESVVSSASDHLGESSGISRELALSSQWLSSAASGKPSGMESSSLRPWQSTGRKSPWAPVNSAGETRTTESACTESSWDETNSETNARSPGQSRARTTNAFEAGQARHSIASTDAG